MSALEQLRQALDHPNVQAFLRVVRAGESHESDDQAYAALYGWKPGNGKVFTDFTDHPRQAFRSSYGWTSAAGAYQAMCLVPGVVSTDTWGDFVRWCAKQNYAPKFGQSDQDLFAAWCLQRRGALQALFEGRVQDAITACNREWASLPGSSYGQPRRTLEQALATYARWGGTTAPDAAAPAPVQVPAPAPAPHYLPAQNDNDVPADPPPAPPNPDPEKPMLPILPQLLIGLAGNLIQAFTPLAQEKLTKELARHTDKPEIAEQVSAGIVAAAQAATGKQDPIEAVAAAKATPAFIQQVEDSALDAIAKMAPVLDRLAALDQVQYQNEEASRAAAAERAHADATDMGPTLAVWAVRGMFAIIAILAGIVAAQVIWTPDHKPSPELVTALVGLVFAVSGKYSTVYDYRFGSSRQSAAKDAVIGELSRKR